MKEKKIKEILLKKNNEFKKAVELHRECEKKLGDLKKKTYLSVEEEIQERELKKKKLSLKDKMYKMILDYKNSL
ncbi:MAG: DUF465 domain-containing protein [Acidobacteriota bacterium]